LNRTFVVTGSASGIGQAIAGRLKTKGHSVLGVDLRDADIEVDLATPAGQQAMASEVARLSGGCIDGVAACAGVLRPDDPEVTLLVNYFGAVATLDLLRTLLARSPRPPGPGHLFDRLQNVEQPGCRASLPGDGCRRCHRQGRRHPRNHL
jgi:NAD(P)-dependent dehydrogenase (short-subunit alcohol dehydrogenase family)